MLIYYTVIENVNELFNVPEIFILHINVKMSTYTGGILTFMSRIKTITQKFKAKKSFTYQHFAFYEQVKIHAQLR